jgi:glycerophosphoryl diester phosphodiesterase
MLSHIPNPAIIAHRGASAYAPENTLAAFELAVRQKADAIELDAKLTIDGHVVVFHDQTLYRTTGAQGRVIDSKLADLRRLDAGSHFDVAYRGEQIPTLDEVFDLVGKRIFINVELTNYASLLDRLPEKVAEIVINHSLAERVMFSSFNPIALIRIRRILPEAPIGLLARPGRQGAWARSWIGTLIRYQSLNPALDDADKRLVARTHRRGCSLLVYTVNQPEEMRRMFQLGVDGIFTHDPLTARRILSAVSEQRMRDRQR